ncbi:AsmA family protein [Sphingobium sp. SCG-1]|uniref:AsmA family protein n=1 Tax=Sphingobium sp. SCG-1 TaxID=2072936 RepID=UPI001CB92D1C|nr:AsmA family protein [Sphingobium sp. SCG-1]
MSWWVKGPLIVALLALLMLIGLAAFPWGALRGTIEQRLSKRLGRPAHIEVLERTDRFSFHPEVTARGVSIPQPRWAGPGDLARVAEARLRFSAFSLLTGHIAVEAFDVRGATVTLIRDRQGRESWDDGAKSEGGGRRPALSRLKVTDSRVIYRDAKRDRSVDLKVEADVRRGLVMRGTGLIKGRPVDVVVEGGAIAGAAADKPWPFRAEIKGAAVGATFKGTMDHPLDMGHLTADATAYGDDLALVDVIIEAGLPGTQPVKLSAKVRRDRPDWTVTNLRGTIGRSDIAGSATIRKRDGRTRIDGDVHSRRFDFSDLASDAGKARGQAKRAEVGDRVVPDTAIDLHSVAKTDGRLRLRVGTLLWPGSSPFRSLRGTMLLERTRLVLDPLELGLTRGRFVGTLSVDQRAGGGVAPSPLLSVAMNVRDARLLDFFPDADIDGKLSGKLRLAGRGRTIRSAIGQSSGVIALVARDGTIPARTASLLGQDIGRGLTTDKRELATLRCMVTRLDVQNGIARANPVLIDTTRALTRASGAVNLRTEQLSLNLAGTPKAKSILRLSGTVPIRGTIKAPDIVIPKETKSVGNVLKMLGRAIAGKQGATAQDADCNALSAQALR